MRRLTMCFCTIIVIVACYGSIYCDAQTYYLGISDKSLGRFAGWPKAGFESNFYEGDLINNVYPDHIEKSHKDLNRIWKLYFGATQANLDVTRYLFNPNKSTSPAGHPDIWPEKQNWIYKKIAVIRYDTLDNVLVPLANGGVSENISYGEGRGYTYSVSVNSVSPGTRIQTKYTKFYLENYNPDNTDNTNVNHGLGYIACRKNSSTEVYGDFYPNGDILIAGADLTENWVLLWDGDESPYLVDVPVLVSFSHRPLSIRIKHTQENQEGIGPFQDIIFEYADGDAVEKTFFISFPFGADAIDQNVTDEWPQDLINDDPDGIIDRCRLINRMVNKWPVGVVERYSFGTTSTGEPSRVFIRNTFSYSYMGSNWTSNGYVPNTSYTVIPPILAMAYGAGLDVFASDSEPGAIRPSSRKTVYAIDIGYPTRYGPLLMVNNSNILEYEIPGAPEHDVHLVGTNKETIWKQRTNRMITLSALTPERLSLTSDPFSNMGSVGEAASLSMVKGWAREHFVGWMEDAVVNRLFNISESRIIKCETSDYLGWHSISGTWENVGAPGVLPWTPANESPEWPTFWFLISRSKNAGFMPCDIDASNGTALEFLYEYALWSGKWNLINEHWDRTTCPQGDISVTEMFRPLQLFHDWAYMAGSHDLWGGGGSQMDMFAAQMAGYDAFGKMATAIGEYADARLARYLAAKAQIPFMMRWYALDYIKEHYKTLSDDVDQVIPGFGEWDPSGPLFDDGKYAMAMEYWTDWTLSGERIHLLGYDILHSLYEPFVASINSFEWAIHRFFIPNMAGVYTYSTDYRVGGFMENKLYGLYKWRYDDWFYTKEQVINTMEFLYSDQSGASDDGKITGCDFKYTSCKVLDWDQGTTDFHDLTGPTIKSRTFPLMPAMVESYNVPVRIGAWAPARLDSAYYDPDTGIFTAKLSGVERISGSPDPIVRLQVDYEPVGVSGGSSYSYDPLWKVVEVGLSGSGPWTISALFQALLEYDLDIVDPVTNLVSDPGFEECGFDKPNYEMGWYLWGDIKATTEDKSSGEQAAVIETPGGSLWQYFWVGRGNELNFSCKYKIGTNHVRFLARLVGLPKESRCGNNAEHGTILDQKWIYYENEQWQDCIFDPITMPDTLDIAAVLFGSETVDQSNDGDVYIDDVILSCPALLPIQGGGGQQAFCLKESTKELPVLSNVSVYPNPFNPTTFISFQLGKNAPVILKVYDVAGREVKTLVERNLQAGVHRIAWDGKNNKGSIVGSGIYLYKLQVSDKMRTGKLVMLK